MSKLDEIKAVLVDKLIAVAKAAKIAADSDEEFPGAQALEDGIKALEEE